MGFVLLHCKPTLPYYLEGFSQHNEGYYFKLIEIGENSTPPLEDCFYWLDLKFKTLNDSVFWDSQHEGANKVFIRATTQAANYLTQYVQQLNAGDSAQLYIKPPIFFKQQFGSERIPYFCQTDCFVKVELKVKQVLTATEWLDLKVAYSNTEAASINTYLKQTAPLAFTDSLGVTWLNTSHLPKTQLRGGEVVTFSFRGQFLDGRFLDATPQTLTYKVGTPDQVLRGINYVIKYLKKDENAKIILPSQLAFGELGSSNGSVPPFTPLVYTLTLIDVKQND